MDFASRAVDVLFWVSALEQALARFDRPEIFNTDQGSQFTSAAATGMLAAPGIRISMDGRGRWMDNVFIERLWRSSTRTFTSIAAWSPTSGAGEPHANGGVARRHLRWIPRHGCGDDAALGQRSLLQGRKENPPIFVEYVSYIGFRAGASCTH